MNLPVIQVANLTKVYKETVAVAGVSFEVRRGETVALLGGNGAGKTTTLCMMLGLLIPTSGTIAILGEDMLRHRYRVLPRMNFSSPYMDLPQRLTVRQNLTVYAKLYGIPALPARLEQLGADLDIAGFMDRPYGQLSAGQKTRVSLAKAFLNEPELLLMDEPTASLDPDMADYVRNYLRAYQQRTGATMFFASHNMVEVERLCSDVILLRAGKVVDQGSPRTLLGRYGRRTMEEVFIDVARRREGAEEPEPLAGAVS
ncbi:MAG: ABC transporter ATP-binding protein [Candidatus Lambdaproteobacteria bacterium]|nr:ABC transporter ATP-binding protein [Candidatus Lambdaproteobacteria bacterium]